MFGKRALQIKMVKASNDETLDETADFARLEPDEIIEIAQELIVHTACTVGAVFVAVTVVKTICKIAEIIVEGNLR